MDSISSYPWFHELAPGIKLLLLASEMHYLCEAMAKKHAAADAPARSGFWHSGLMRDGANFAGGCFAWGKQNQLLPTVAA